MGINAIELMPAYEFQECTRKETVGSMAVRSKKDDRINYWGYAQGFYFAPKASYCATREPDREFRDMVHALHQAGIECIMEMYFPERYAVIAGECVPSGCGNCYYHVDGFHLTGRWRSSGSPRTVIRFFMGQRKLFSDDSAGNADTENMLAEYNAGFMLDMRRFP